jgi:membrane associated rhomboid family serine protease
VERRRANQLSQIAIFLVALFVIHAVSVATGMWLARFGVIPRTAIGLRGILFSPVLHVSWSHLMANAVPLAVMLCLLALSKKGSLWPITAAIWTLSGLAVWLVGRPGSIQIGASSLIYGLAAFLVTSAWTSRNVKSALVALAVIFFYGGIVWGLLPGTPGVSWEGHLCGAIAGFLVARVTRAPGRARLP